MKREMISEALNELDARYITESAVFDPAAASPERNADMKPKRIITFLLAAALIMSLGLAAYAIGSVHVARQRTLREDFRVEQGNTESYVEYDVSDEQASGAVLLSAINDGEEQRLYVDLAPVTEAELVDFPGELSFGWTIEGSERWGMAFPQLHSDRSLSGYEALHAAVLEDAYDRESETLTLVCYLPNSALLELPGARDAGVRLSFSMKKGETELRRFGPVNFVPTAEETRVFDFSGVQWRDEETGKEATLLGLELTPVSAVWRITYPEAAALHTPASTLPPEEAAAWSLLEDKVTMDAQLIFSDGTVFSTGGALTCPYRNGAVELYCGWGPTVNIADVQRIVLGDQLLWEAP